MGQLEKAKALAQPDGGQPDRCVAKAIVDAQVKMNDLDGAWKTVEWAHARLSDPIIPPQVARGDAQQALRRAAQLQADHDLWVSCMAIAQQSADYLNTQSRPTTRTSQPGGAK